MNLSLVAEMMSDGSSRSAYRYWRTWGRRLRGCREIDASIAVGEGLKQQIILGNNK
jgi:hypothetical protein